nr:hypothetical protein [Butyrivibrio sp.]
LMSTQNLKSVKCINFGSMIKSDIYKLLSGSFFYVMTLTCFIIPILVIVMKNAFEGANASFSNVWQALGTVYDGSILVSTDLKGLCNINLIFLILGIFECLFIYEDFSSGYSNIIFTVRSKRTSYSFSKIIIGIIVGEIMIVSYLVGTFIGGIVSGISFEMIGFDYENLVYCLLSKGVLVAVFVSVYEFISIIARKKIWLLFACSLFFGGQLFMISQVITPINASNKNVIVCFVFAIIFGIGIGISSGKILEKINVI